MKLQHPRSTAPSSILEGQVARPVAMSGMRSEHQVDASWKLHRQKLVTPDIKQGSHVQGSRVQGFRVHGFTGNAMVSIEKKYAERDAISRLFS